MTDKPIGLADHLDHAGLDGASDIFELGLVELRGDLDRLAKQKDAASERQSEMKAVPGPELAPAAGRISDRQDRDPSDPSDIYGPGSPSSPGRAGRPG